MNILLIASVFLLYFSLIALLYKKEGEALDDIYRESLPEYLRSQLS